MKNKYDFIWVLTKGNEQVSIFNVQVFFFFLRTVPKQERNRYDVIAQYVADPFPAQSSPRTMFLVHPGVARRDAPPALLAGAEGRSLGGDYRRPYMWGQQVRKDMNSSSLDLPNSGPLCVPLTVGETVSRSRLGVTLRKVYI